MKGRFELSEADIRRAIAAFIGAVRGVNANEANVTLFVEEGRVRAEVEVEAQK